MRKKEKEGGGPAGGGPSAENLSLQTNKYRL